MGSLDAYKDEILTQLLDGDWKNLFPTKIYASLEEWLNKHSEKSSVSIRFTFYNPVKEVGRYAVYLICNPKVKNGKVDVKNLEFSLESLPLAIPPPIYNLPLYCMPSDLLQKILKRKKFS